MQGLYEDLRTTLTWFCREQRESFGLVVCSEEPDVAMVASVLGGLDQSDSQSVYLTFGHRLVTARAFVDVCVEMVELQRRGIDERRGERGEEPWPAIPAECRDPALGGDVRIRHLLAYVRARVAVDTPIVLSLIPAELRDVDGYARMARALLPSPALEPWMRHVRLILRDARERPFLVPTLLDPEPDGVVVYTADFSPKALEEGLAADAARPSLPPRQRALALLQSAGLDFAHQRYVPALEKYGLLYNLFDDLREPGLAALCLCGAGDVYRRVGQLDEASLRYRQGLHLVREGQSPPVMLNLLMGVGHVCLEQQRFADAEQYWDLAARVAAAQLKNVMALPECMEWVGVARLGLGDSAGAIRVWEGALEVVEEHPNPTRKVSVLRRMVDFAEATRWEAKREEYRQRLAVAEHEAKGASHAST